MSYFDLLVPEDWTTVSSWAKKIDPLFGEMAFLLAITLKVISKLYEARSAPPKSYVIPLPISMRNLGARILAPGNPLSFLYLIKESGEVHSKAVSQLTASIAKTIRELVGIKTLENSLAFMSLVRFLPNKIYRWLLKSPTKGALASCLFANTGPISIGPRIGEQFSVLGIPVKKCFHRPMVSFPPGIGFFFSIYNKQLMISIEGISPVFRFEDLKKLGENFKTEVYKVLGL